MRYELSDYEWTAIKPMLPNKSRGVPREVTVACSTVSFGSYAQALRGAICRKPTVLAPLAISVVLRVPR
jgi:transposase